MKPFVHHKIDQTEDSDWLKLRVGLITMSNLHLIMANSVDRKSNFDANKAFGDPAKDYAIQLALEQIKGDHLPSSYNNEHMQRGKEDEPKARALYEQETFCSVDPGGFYCNDEIGYSPDGLVFRDEDQCRYKGAIECKSRKLRYHFANVNRQSFEPSSRWQCIGALKYIGFDWIDFVSYNGDFPEGRQLYIYRMYPENFRLEFEWISERVGKFQKLIEETKDKIQNANYQIIG